MSHPCTHYSSPLIAIIIALMPLRSLSYRTRSRYFMSILQSANRGIAQKRENVPSPSLYTRYGRTTVSRHWLPDIFTLWAVQIHIRKVIAEGYVKFFSEALDILFWFFFSESKLPYGTWRCLQNAVYGGSGVESAWKVVEEVHGRVEFSRSIRYFALIRFFSIKTSLWVMRVSAKRGVWGFRLRAHVGGSGCRAQDTIWASRRLSRHRWRISVSAIKSLHMINAPSTLCDFIKVKSWFY